MNTQFLIDLETNFKNLTYENVHFTVSAPVQKTTISDKVYYSISLQNQTSEQPDITVDNIKVMRLFLQRTFSTDLAFSDMKLGPIEIIDIFISATNIPRKWQITVYDANGSDAACEGDTQGNSSVQDSATIQFVESETELPQ